MSDAETIEEIDYEIGQDNIEVFGLDIHNPVFVVSALSIIALVLFTLMFQEGAAEMFGALRPWLTSTFDWVFMGAANLFVLFCLLLVVTPLGKVRLGGIKTPSCDGLRSLFAGLRYPLPGTVAEDQSDATPHQPLTGHPQDQRRGAARYRHRHRNNTGNDPESPYG